MTDFQNAVKERLRTISSEGGADEASPKSETTVKPEEVHELILDGTNFNRLTQEDAEYLKQFESLVKFSCNQTGLQKLDSFPVLPNLKVLELTDNHISSLEELPRICPSVRTLVLGGNRIKTLKQIEPLKSLSALEFLHLELTSLASTVSYRSEVLAALPCLKALDGLDREGNTLDEEDDEYEEDEGEELSDDEGEERTTLEQFYTTDYVEDDDEDQGEFAPDEEDEDDEIEDEDEDVDETEEDQPRSASAGPTKRKGTHETGDAEENSAAPDTKKPRLEAE